MAYEVVMSYHLHMPSYFLGTFTEYPYVFSVIPGCFYIPVPYFFYKNIRKLNRTKSQINDTVELQHTLKSD